MSATTLPLHRPSGAAPRHLSGRLAFAVVFIAALVAGIAWQGAGTLALWAPLVLADVPLAGLRDGVLRPRWVPVYNAVHAVPGPLLAGALAAATGSAMLGAIALGWLAHVAMDRAAGFGLRTADGQQR